MHVHGARGGADPVLVHPYYPRSSPPSFSYAHGHDSKWEVARKNITKKAAEAAFWLLPPRFLLLESPLSTNFPLLCHAEFCSAGFFFGGSRAQF